jgi:hypothetical protein
VDTELSAIGVMSTGGEWISVLANYSMHYVDDFPNGTITADYFGVFARHITNQLKAGNQFVAMLSNGTSGEANAVQVKGKTKQKKWSEIKCYS